VVLGATVVLALALSGCAAPSPSATSRPSSPTASGGTTAQLGADHQCIVGADRSGVTAPQVAWAQLRNPILSEPTAGVKDQALVWSGGLWHMLFSYVTNDGARAGGEHWNIASATSPDLVHWSAPSPWPTQPGVDGVASPDIVRSPQGLFVATYDSNPDAPGAAQSKLYYRTSTDLDTWSAPEPLGLSLHPAPGDRMIDAALAWTGHGLILGYKYGTATGSSAQHFEIGWSRRGSLDGPWTSIGRPDIVVHGDTVENYEFVALAGRWHLVATSNTFDQPWIFELSGDPSVPASWLHWSRGRMLVIPSQSWDSGPGLSSVGFEHANSVFLCDARAADGYYYATYAGSAELTQFGGWGHAEIGIARSTDLVHWQLPG
jgi:hypothetical protein